MLNTTIFNILRVFSYSMRLPLLVLTILFSQLSIANTVVTHTAPAHEHDRRQEYEVAALRLLLEKTRRKYGDFELVSAPAHVTPLRGVESLRQNKHRNYVRLHGYTRKLSMYPELSYIDFPIQLGILGYRICFVSKNNKAKVAQADSIEKLREFTYGLVKGWSDTQVLRRNGFTVHAAIKYDTLFEMTAINRFDLFCRGANEIKAEYDQHKNIPGLAVDESFAFYYPHPRFFFTHKDNKHILHRLREGLKIADSDGSLLKLWKTFHQESLDFVKLSKRRIFKLENSDIQDIDVEQYFYHPPTE